MVSFSDYRMEGRGGEGRGREGRGGEGRGGEGRGREGRGGGGRLLQLSLQIMCTVWTDLTATSQSFRNLKTQ